MPEGVIITPELPSIPVQEAGPLSQEINVEHSTTSAETVRVNEPAVVAVNPIVVTPPQAQASSAPALAQKVEAVLSEGLEETYKRLDPVTQKKFRDEGEITAQSIATILQSSKIQMRKIVELIVKWLKIIPGVNYFFLEQEAKIKAGKLMSMPGEKK